MTICLADRRRLTLSEHELVDADVVRAEGFDETRRDICRGRASFHLHTAIVQTIDSNLPTSTCDDGELESHTSEMGMLSKAKLAAKQAALKGVPKSTRDLSLGKVAAAARKPILVSRTRSRAGERNKKKSKSSDPTLPQSAVRDLPVSAKVVGVQPPSDLNHERERRVLCSVRRRAITAASRLNAQEASSASEANPQDYGSITQLRELLGLAPSQNTHDAVALPEDALIVSIDTEWEHRRLRDFVVEVGITVLDTRDIINVAPGKFGDDWFSKTKTYHYVASATKRRKERIGGCFFSKDVFGTYATIKRDIVSVLQQATHPPSDGRPVGRGPRKVVLVGHSVVADLQQLYRSPGLALDLLSTDVFLTKPNTVFDTFMLTVAARKQGANIRQRRLGWLVNWLGVHPRYRRYNAVIGCHNAGNDAAYTMMALLMYAIRWDQIVPGKIVPLLSEETKAQRKMGSRPHGSTLSLEELRSRLDDSTLEENASVISEQLVEPITLPSSTPSASAEVETEYVEHKPLSSSSPDASAKAPQNV